MRSKADQLVNAWIEGDLSPEDEEALRTLLTEDPAAREACYDLMLLDQLLGEREDARGAFAPGSLTARPKQKSSPFGKVAAAVAALAAVVTAGFWIANRPAPAGNLVASPPITASADSRITIAQRENRDRWSPGELLRLERGTAAIQLGKGVLAHFEGPAAIELVNTQGDIRLFDGRGSFQVTPGGRTFKVEAPGGEIRGTDGQFICQILPDQAALVEVNSGSVELRPHGSNGTTKISSGEAIRLEGDGTLTPTARPFIPFRSGLPEELALFRDDFESPEGTLLSEHTPELGEKWQVLEETKTPTVIKMGLDTSGGARRLLAPLAPHDPGGTGSVYVFSFLLRPPVWTYDKVQRMDGFESIAIVDPEGNEIFSLVAEAMNTHRWQLRGGGVISPPTPVCALWDHQLTVCYGMDGRVTMHDGGTAQAPVIASIWLKHPAPVKGLLVSNRTGGDLAFRKIGTSLLKAPVTRAE
ncbi:hypothetical protein OKA04_23710 [Luteolibacter flavescens]|uniref:FecR protein domain-containing protein n=1 Tax=Luteolibacter flavescens TaxID=1859460 RepID=A0ABT3FW09_9BACT|nr:hypothetical protein [Luteolibacter flavescens]MCW1887765.1 hypothetical protein [Luteolibacter flavescens]